MTERVRTIQRLFSPAWHGPRAGRVTLLVDWQSPTRRYHHAGTVASTTKLAAPGYAAALANSSAFGIAIARLVGRGRTL
jgi:hypothetical protein